MSTDYAERIDHAMQQAYGPFQPGTVARAIRLENWQNGDSTCWHCLRAFRPHVEIDAAGRRHRRGRGRWYCSRECARADSRPRRTSNHPTAYVVGGELVLDLRRLRGVVA